VKNNKDYTIIIENIEDIVCHPEILRSHGACEVISWRIIGSCDATHKNTSFRRKYEGLNQAVSDNKYGVKQIL